MMSTLILFFSIVIMITAYTTVSKVLSSRFHGAADYLLKPLSDLSDLDQVMDRALDSLRRWDEVVKLTRENRQSS